MQLVLPDLCLPHKVTFPLLIIPLDASRLQEVLAEREVLRVVGDGVQTKDSELEFWVAGVAVELAFVGADVTDEAVNVLFGGSVRVDGRTNSRRTLIITSKNLRDPVYWWCASAPSNKCPALSILQAVSTHTPGLPFGLDSHISCISLKFLNRPSGSTTVK